MRKKITAGMSLIDVMVLMSEGNPGAVTVLAQIMEKQGTAGYLTLLFMDDMNLRGSRIWLAYKDHCGENIDTLIQAVKVRDLDMVATVNKARGTELPDDERAVPYGASYDKGPR